MTEQELIIRPVLLGPVSIAMFITSSAVMLPLTFFGDLPVTESWPMPLLFL
jgi:hypothetical protein